MAPNTLGDPPERDFILRRDEESGELLVGGLPLPVGDAPVEAHPDDDAADATS